jgi:hypothetical protein
MSLVYRLKGFERRDALRNYKTFQASTLASFHQRNEPSSVHRLAHQLVSRSSNSQEGLFLVVADRCDKTPALCQLGKERAREAGRRGADEDHLEGCVIGPTKAPVPDSDVCHEPEVGDSLSCGIRERLDNLHGIDVCSKGCQECGLEPRPRTHLQDALAPGYPCELQMKRVDGGA